ncbi:MAG: acetolactate synthase small subunit [Planctomycetia bacterium]|jgi:acetolactate synthase-1/3 small subunit|uniref:Acetolactate synthase small subunit n=1 Tax=Candidatus Brocadia sapporoensis TaxID=392547 RepID=A0A1V6LZ01_9BACT|nr:acetolactate synthase small subunit [Candidatus Brocadia sapporoensis]MCC7239390.1 acetolactate synthase small subunit [Candidatus Brocadia sp.]MEB2307715.1 acetolactate synthase small subunit [Candidatus Brocadiaceae bacterium]OQZ04120.1 MAG: acetolactate synthase small subunit [Candidatus Brocadia sp. UTAMX1]QOJ07118.1 MAG: acetolactate synthase small subunit [Planctomycetia bacterium]RZV58261.1 MAG: acetolactate synthase small subunit [Candidatus Brocadia sp. BROELEC01]TVL97865.1 MAG: a
MRHVISLLVENKVGVLARITGLISGRGFNIDSLAVGETENPALSRMTIVVRGDDAILEQVRKQLGKIIDIIKVIDFTDEEFVERDLMLLKVNVPAGKRGEIIEIVEIFRGKIIDVSQKDLVIELAGAEEKLEAMVNLLRPYGIKELVRTGSIAIGRGTK